MTAAQPPALTAAQSEQRATEAEIHPARASDAVPRRARKLLRTLGTGPLTAYELALKMWGNVAVTQAYLTISEVLGHLDLLIRDGSVRAQDGPAITRFCATGA